jgi:hypothetical protein
MGNIMCENYYCQSVSFKPEWFSESSWKIEYNTKKKPYIIDKGIIKIKHTEKFNLLLSKKLMIDFNEVKNISVPINFKYYIKTYFDLYIIFSNKELILSDMNNLNIETNDFFFVNLKLSKNNISIMNSFDSNITDKKIHSKRNNNFLVELENNFNLLLINEKLNNIFEKNFLYNFSFNENNDYYINLFIKIENNLQHNEFIELNFE